MGRQRRRMAAGDAQRVWFPALIEMVRQAGDPAMSMDALLRLRDRLNTTLQTIRHTRKILPAMMWCPHCQVRHRAAPPPACQCGPPSWRWGGILVRPPPRSRPSKNGGTATGNNISWIGMASRRTRWPRLANAPVSRGECLRDKPSRVLPRLFHDCLPTRQRNVRYHDRSAAPIVRAACWSALLSRLASA